MQGSRVLHSMEAFSQVGFGGEGGLGFRVEGLGFRVEGLGLKVGTQHSRGVSDGF